MKILIYGGGAVGLGIANCLIKAGEKVDIISLKDTVLSLKKHGLVRTGALGTYHADKDSFNAYSFLSELSGTAYDYILVCTKSFDSWAAAKNISKHPQILVDKTKIILFQNGWGNADIFANFFPTSVIYNARVITGFCRPDNHHVEITVHADPTHIGSIYGMALSDIKPLCDSISKGGLPCDITQTIIKDLWAKMMYNCALNPLGAIFNVPYGDLGESGYTRSIMVNVIQEIYGVMRKSGYSTYWESPEEYLELFFNELIPATAKHEASTLQDIRSKKKTEIDALNGAVVKLGEACDVDVGTNRLIYRLIKFMESRYLF